MMPTVRRLQRGRSVSDRGARSWNGGLVLYAHGLRGTLDSPLTSHLADRGYALAASSYRAEGYRVDLFVDDMRALLELFIKEVRRPRWAIIHGRSMGGHVAIASTLGLRWTPIRHSDDPARKRGAP